MGLVLSTPPSAEPVTLAEAKTHLRVDGTDEDTLITTHIAAARRQVEIYTGAGLVTQRWTETFDGFPCSPYSGISLTRGPVLSIVSVAYLDTAGQSQTLSSATYVLNQTPLSADLWLVSGQSWPATQAQRGAVTIVYSVGFGSGSTAIPDDIRASILLRIADLYRNREAQGALLTENRTACNLVDGYVRKLVA
jgi:uncharacterized phiE125 gp8 family phage protein